MNNTVTANDLKTKGVSTIENFAKQGLETIVTVHGKEKYVVVTKEEFDRLRECELTAAIIESEADLKNGRYKEGSVEGHIKRITNA
ncbi:MAG: type II toxin-antitoxin system prevent-host-death family antitoxin [Candidatus Gracilibacteria bacterium]